MSDELPAVETRYSVHVFEVFAEGESAAPRAHRDIVVSVTTDSPTAVDELARAAAARAWPSVHHDALPENIGTEIIARYPEG